MMNTGIKTSEAAVDEFKNLRMSRAHRYLILRVNDDKTEVEIEHLGVRDATFDEFKEKMPKDQCR